MKNIFEKIAESFLATVITVLVIVGVGLAIIVFMVIDDWLYDRSGGGHIGIHNKTHNSQLIFRGICLFLVFWFCLFLFLITGE